MPLTRTKPILRRWLPRPVLCMHYLHARTDTSPAQVDATPHATDQHSLVTHQCGDRPMPRQRRRRPITSWGMKLPASESIVTSRVLVRSFLLALLVLHLVWWCGWLFSSCITEVHSTQPRDRGEATKEKKKMKMKWNFSFLRTIWGSGPDLLCTRHGHPTTAAKLKEPYQVIPRRYPCCLDRLFLLHSKM